MPGFVRGTQAAGAAGRATRRPSRPRAPARVEPLAPPAA